MRVLVVWCPDWSVVAALEEAGHPAEAPAAVLAAHRVEVCNGPARALGVRRGQRRRDAQARCPELAVLPANPDRDARAFEPVLATVEELRPGVAALRPGLLAVRAPGRVFGTEEHAAATVCKAVVDTGVWDVRLGVADDLFTAEQAARTVGTQEWRLVPGGESAAFLRRLPVETLEADGAEGREVVSLLRRLGLATLGDLAELPGDAVEQRLGRYGRTVWRRARGSDPASFAARKAPPELDLEVAFEPPLESVEAVTFSVRTTAERFVEQLAHHQLVATAVRVEAEADGAVVSSRTWLHPRFFSARDLVDRVHWQLQASEGSALRSRKHAGDRPGPRRADQVRPRRRRARGRPRRDALGPRRRRPRRTRSRPGPGHGRLRRRPPAGAPGRAHPGEPPGHRALGRATGRPAPDRPSLAGPRARTGPGPGLRRPASRPRSSTTAADRSR